MALIGNKILERDLRDWLDATGHYGRSAELEELELAAVQRPGWVQVFRFRVRAKNKATGEWDHLRGLARDDERAKRREDRTDVRLTPDDAAHDALFARWSEGLITLRTRGAGGERAAGGASARAALAALAVLATVGGLIAAAAWLK